MSQGLRGRWRSAVVPVGILILGLVGFRSLQTGLAPELSQNRTYFSIHVGQFIHQPAQAGQIIAKPSQVSINEGRVAMFPEHIVLFVH